jgi:ribosome-binding ATPase YchF (GTP1/OBG family)/pimeloyl-ACP methyl ester carboxylesterase
VSSSHVHRVTIALRLVLLQLQLTKDNRNGMQAVHQKLHVLCLHGFMQDGDVLRNKMARLKQILADVAVLHFPHAPFVTTDDEGLRFGIPAATTPDEAATRRRWFRSHGNATDGWSEVMQTLNTFCDATGSEQPFDIIMGFSQGCKVAAKVLGYVQMLRDGAESCGLPEETGPAPHPGLMRLRGAMLVGGPAADMPDVVIRVPSLHVIGTNDTLVPPASQMQLAQLFANPTIFSHPSGHVVPSNAAAGREFVSFLQGLLEAGDAGGLLQIVDDEVEALSAIFGDTIEVVRYSDKKGNGNSASFSGVDSNAVTDTTVRVEIAPEASASYAEAERKVRAAASGLDLKSVKRAPKTAVYFAATVGGAYPADAASCRIEGLPDAVARCSRWLPTCHAALYDEAQNLKGGPMLFQLLTLASEEVAQHLEACAARLLQGADGADGAEAVDEWQQPEDMTSLIDAAFKAAHASRKAAGDDGGAPPAVAYKGRSAADMKYVIGLVGKPSAGKSTFFNAVTDPDAEAAAAKVGAFPFTTIEPNYGTAFTSCPCPCQIMPAFGRSERPLRCNAEFGHHVRSGQRRLPVLVKDVAGLVPGAYLGKGKGNKFLNDLCDADVLVHVIDGSGRSSADGQEIAACDANDEANTVGVVGASTPVHDAEWVRREIHSWIFGNVAGSWAPIRARPVKLLTMFSGYHATLDLVELALRRCGVTHKTLHVRIPAWGPADLHAFVAHFVLLRFPILLALNKSDTPTAAAHLDAVRRQLPEQPSMAMSARLECGLLELRRRGAVQYIGGDATAVPVADVVATMDGKTSAAVAKTTEALQKVGSTGVHEVLAAAIALRPAMYLYPVVDLQSLHTSAGKVATAADDDGAAPQNSDVLRDCILLKRGATVDDAFRVLAKRDLVSGRLVRSEGIDMGAVAAAAAAGDVTAALQPRIMRKDEVLPAAAVVKMMANKPSTTR